MKTLQTLCLSAEHCLEFLFNMLHKLASFGLPVEVPRVRFCPLPAGLGSSLMRASVAAMLSGVRPSH